MRTRNGVAGNAGGARDLPMRDVQPRAGTTLTGSDCGISSSRRLVSYCAWMATLMFTVIGDDRPGLVSTVSAPVSAHGANWERSRFARLAGKFAGIVLVTVPDGQLDALTEDLRALEAQGLQLDFERTDKLREQERQQLRLELIGADHPGIVAEITASLASRRVTIEELSTDVRDAPMAGGTVFEAQALLEAPPSMDTDSLRSMLEDLADDLMVEVTLSEE
jgi:glycine cleavage system regulatory protein